MLFHLRMGTRKKPVAMISIEKEWIEIRFFFLADCTYVYEWAREKMSNLNWGGEGDGGSARNNGKRKSLLFYIPKLALHFSYNPKQLLNFKC